MQLPRCHRLGMPFLSWLGLVATLVVPASLKAQDRRFLTTPGIVVETGARHAACDALAFTRDGKRLFAAGDDKVVRSWPVGPVAFTRPVPKIYRWPIFREQLGGIFAIALSKDERKIAIGGFGLKPGMVAVLDRASGDIEHILETPLTAQVTREIAFSPDGRHVIIGTDYGELFRWKPALGDKGIIRLHAGTPGTINRVRLITFLDQQTALVVTQDGKIREWDILSGTGKLLRTCTFQLGSLYRVAVSPDRRWLVACAELVSGREGARARQVHLIDYRKLRADGDDATGARFPVPVSDGAARRYPRAVAFDETSRLLAVGIDEANTLPARTPEFQRLTGGKVHVYSIANDRWLTRDGLNVGYRVNNIAFRPGHPGQLATAGGPNQEVQLWDYRKENRALDTIRSPGSSLWSVAPSTDGKYLAWRERLNPDPHHPNERGSGPWRVFPLRGPTRAIATTVPTDFTPQLPLRIYGGWRVVPSASGFLWDVKDPDGNTYRLDERSKLYFDRVAQIPRCYSFIPPDPKTKKPIRLAVGHQWGVSIYELRPTGVRLVRVLMGHEGEVMSVAPSADGRLLFTASRDQTIACWSLVDWPGQRELGIHLDPTSGKLIVKKVELGSLAWELGLTDGDEIVMVASPDILTARTGFLFDPYEIREKKYDHVRIGKPEICDLATITAKLARAEAWRQYIIVWRHKGKEEIGLRRVQQRPLWRFYPTRKEQGSDWILWRWRDFYYDASERADRLVGWHVNVEKPNKQFTGTPRFYPLESFRGRDLAPGAKGKRGGFHNPDKVWPTVQLAFQSPEKVQIADIEPPEIRLDLAQEPDAKTDLVVRANVRPLDRDAAGQKLSRVVLWLDDSLYEGLPVIRADGTFDARITIPRARLRRGTNQVRLLAFNAAGGRAEARPLQVAFADGSRGRPNLLALCVGINDYSHVKFERRVSDLKCARADAEEIATILRQHKKSGLFDQVQVMHIADDQVTVETIAERIQTLSKLARPDDLFVLFLSGHGTATRTEESYLPGSFSYVCVNSNEKQRATLLQARQLRALLQDIPCRKLILLDACHSGAIVSSPTRDLNSDGAGFIILSACQPSQAALEPNPKLTGMKNGLFTQGLMAALSPSQLGLQKQRRNNVTAEELGTTIKTTLRTVLPKLKVRADAQTPVFSPEKLPTIAILCRP